MICVASLSGGFGLRFRTNQLRTAALQQQHLSNHATRMQQFVVPRKSPKVRTEIRGRADVFVVADWRKPGQRDAWRARLRGARLASWGL
eukprot:482502-Alexandrium_andersonii.AAC.1